MSNKISQCERILQYIADFGSISTLEAFRDLKGANYLIWYRAIMKGGKNDGVRSVIQSANSKR